MEVIRHMARDTEVVEEGGLTHAALIATLAMMELSYWISCEIRDKDDSNYNLVNIKSLREKSETK